MPTASVLSIPIPLVGNDGNDTFFANTKVPGVGVGSTMEGGAGADSFEFNSYGLTSVKLYANQDNDTIRLTGPTVETSLFGGKGKTAFKSAIHSPTPISSPTAAMTLLMSLLASRTLSCMPVRVMTDSL